VSLELGRASLSCKPSHNALQGNRPGAGAGESPDRTTRHKSDKPVHALLPGFFARRDRGLSSIISQSEFGDAPIERSSVKISGFFPQTR
jgi:hypothetical protein